MATNQAPDDDGERCGTAWEAVSGVALEHCQSREAILDLTARSVGLDGDEIAEQTEAGDVTDGICTDPHETRKWVAVRMADLIEDRDVGLVEAQSEAWGDVIDACDDRGHAV